MNTLKERIRWLMQEYGLTQRQVADIAGIKQPSVAGWVSGRTVAIKPEPAYRLAQRLPIRLEWLLNGEGDPKAPGAGSVRTYSPRDDDTPEGMTAVREYRMSFAAGAPEGCQVDWEELHESSPYWIEDAWLQKHGLMADRCRIGRVRGDSMEPTLCDGDKFLWYDELHYAPGCVSVVDGKIYAIAIEGNFRIKRLQKIKQGLQIISDNPEYATERYVGDECDQICIFGRVYRVVERDL